MINYKYNVLLKSLYHFYKKICSNRYTIGVMEFEERVVETICDNSTLKFHWIKDNYKKGWFADPFILRLSDSEIVFLVEEFVYCKNRGVISKLIVNRKNYSIKSVKTILDTGSHLSFPAYYRKNGKVYIYPESGERGATYLYEYNEDNDEIKELYMINPNVTADTILVDLPISGGGRYQLCTTEPTCNKDILDIYPFKEEPCSPVLSPIARIKVEKMTARNAGVVFEVNGRMYRPAQDCTYHYGECTEIQELIVNDNSINFRPVNRIYSPNHIYPDSFHTFNVFENCLVAVDARKKRFPILAKLLGK